MKFSVIKVLSIVTALCLLLTAMPISVSASDEELCYLGEISTIKYYPGTELDIRGNNTVNRFYGNGSLVDTSKYFYNQLTANQKSFYNQIWEAGIVETIEFDLTGVTITGKSTSSSKAQTNASNNAQQDLVMAMTALIEDNPMFFWATSFRPSAYTTKKYSGGEYTYTVVALSIEIVLDTTNFSDFNDVKAKYAAVEEKLATIPVYGISRHEKIKSINDYLAKNIVYDPNIELHVTGEFKFEESVIYFIKNLELEFDVNQK
jgi:hypothetical protein